jgi:hypothetical protein
MNDLSDGIWIRDLGLGAGPLVSLPKELSQYKIDLVGVQETGWGRWWHQTRRRIYISLWKGE